MNVPFGAVFGMSVGAVIDPEQFTCQTLNLCPTQSDNHTANTVDGRFAIYPTGNISDDYIFCTYG